MRSLLQTKLWADFKARHGWLVHPVSLAGIPQPTFVLERALAFGQSMLYAPELSVENWSAVLPELTVQARKLSPAAIFFRLELFEPLSETTESLVVQLTQAGYRKSFEAVQPEHRQWVSISDDETKILANMKEKGRYNVRLAQKKGVITRVSTNVSDVEVFYKIFQQTAARDGFKIRGLKYFQDLCQTLFDHNVGELVIAEFAGQPLVALVLTYYNGLASYLYGASSNQQRNLMAPYAAHFAAIQAAKQRGCETYDLLQIAPADDEGNAPNNRPYANLTRFKQQFGGQRIDLVGSWDLVFKPFWYSVFKAAEQLRRH